MAPDRRALLGAGLLGGGLIAAGAAAAAPLGPEVTWAETWQLDPVEVIPLWPGEPPGGEKVTVKEEVLERAARDKLRDRAVTGIRKPTLTLFRPAKPNGAAVILIPGGGYQRVVIDKEGFEGARRLAVQGYTVFVLLYRLPGDGWAAGPDAPLQDAQRAVRLVRGRAGALGFEPNRIAVQGFSAGGNLAARLITRFARKTYEPVDADDALAARPDLGTLVYPVISFREGLAHGGSRDQMLGPSPSQKRIDAYSAEVDIPAGTPPTFLLHAADDPTVPVANSLVMFSALKLAGAAAELHVFEEGGHGFGIRFTTGKPVAAWPQLWTAFAKRHGV